jgi:predicted enzyme related to lactoylglutathione lyase
MTGITGLGGVFVKAANKEDTANWYRDNLGLALEPYGGINFGWRNEEDPSRKGYSLFFVFKKDTDYFGETSGPAMINFRVENLDAYLAQLRQAGVTVIDKIEDGEYGRFGWIEDPEGMRIELWEPPEGQRG